jgi:hypothetical protein
VDVLQVLPLVLEHGGIWYPKCLRSLLLLSKSIKQALKACKVPCLYVHISVKRKAPATKLPGFALWFAQYGHLVREVDLACSDHEEYDDICTVAQTMISLAFSGAAANGVRAPGLQVFRATSRLCGPAMLSSLPAHSIKTMDLTMTSPEIAVPSLPLLFQQFSNLHTLNITVDDTWIWNGQVKVVQLPAALFLSLPQCLETLSFSHEGTYLLDIGHLTSLRELTVEAIGGLVEGSTLPRSLLAATFVNTSMPGDACNLLSALQQLTLEPTYLEPPGPILQLSALKGLQELRLKYEDLPSAAAGAAAWGRLPQLRALQVSGGIGSVVECQAVLKRMAGVSGLTSVELDVTCRGPQPPCGVYLAQLLNLQELVLHCATPSRQDMLHLRKLTRLTTLELSLCSIDDATAVELLGSLTGLQSLALSQSESGPQEPKVATDAIVPAIKYQLKGLRKLSLKVPGVTEASVDLLEELTQLTRLKVVGLSGQSVDRLRQVLVGCKINGRGF